MRFVPGSLRLRQYCAPFVCILNFSGGSFTNKQTNETDKVTMVELGGLEGWLIISLLGERFVMECVEMVNLSHMRGGWMSSCVDVFV